MAQGGRDRNKDYVLHYQNQMQWHPKTEAANWNKGREIVINVRRTETLLSNRDVHIPQHYERQKWYSTAQAGNLEIEKGKGAHWRGKKPLMREVKANFTILPRHKDTEGE